MSDKTGGPAFPIPLNPEDEYLGPADGMTLRDYFVAKAMAEVLAVDIRGSRRGPNEVAKYSYQMADAMLKEREK